MECNQHRARLLGLIVLFATVSHAVAFSSLSTGGRPNHCPLYSVFNLRAAPSAAADDNFELIRSDSHDDGYHNPSSSRRRTIFKNMIATTTMGGSALWASISSIPAATAACLAGDTSEDCIGFYKMPINDETLKYIETPELLAKYAPDLRWVPPPKMPITYEDACQELNTMAGRCTDLERIVLMGNLTAAGMELLAITPRVTVAGTYIVQALNDEAALQKNDTNDLSMRAYRTEVALVELQIRLGQSDITLGQGIRGQLGAVTLAQIAILSEIKEANGFFADVLKALPDHLTGKTGKIGKQTTDSVPREKKK